MKRIRGIIESTTEPITTDCIWIRGSEAMYFTNGQWTYIGESSEGREELEKKVDELDKEVGEMSPKVDKSITSITAGATETQLYLTAKNNLNRPSITYLKPADYLSAGVMSKYDKEVLGVTESIDISSFVNNQIDQYTTTGTYRIYGQHTNPNDGLPILNYNPGHTIEGVLKVLDSSISGSGEDTDKVVTQVLTMSNRTGGDGHIWIRTGQGVDKSSLTWSTWEKLQGLYEMNEVLNISDINGYTTNGMYSGIIKSGGTISGKTIHAGTTFLIVTINGYAVAASGLPPQATQMVYLLPAGYDFSTGMPNLVKAELYIRTASYNSSSKTYVWGDFVSLGAVTEEEKIAILDRISELNDDVNAANSKIVGLIDDVSEIREEMRLGSTSYVAAAWGNPEDLSPNASVMLGDASCAKFDFLLIDHTRNDINGTTPVAVLQGNNLLRVAQGDGSDPNMKYAPVVGISQEWWNECMANKLYMSSSDHPSEIIEAGSFDPVKYYEEHMCPVYDGSVWRIAPKTDADRLYKENGEEVTHYLLPWETTEKKYSVMKGCRHSLWLIHNVAGKSGKRWNVVSSSPITFDGITGVELKPTAISPSPVSVITDTDGLKKVRCQFTMYRGETNNQGSIGETGCNVFNEERGYPCVNEIQQISLMKYSRNNNVDVKSPMPFAEGGFHALNTFLCTKEAQYGRRDLHNANFFASGISSNESCDASLFSKYGGVRYIVDGITYYGTYVTNPSIIAKDEIGTKASLSVFLNKDYPKEACLESQMAASFATEMGIEANGSTVFEMYGNTYTVENVNGAVGLDGGEMNVIVRSVRSTNFSAYSMDGNPISVQCDINLRMSLIDGMNLSGDILAYCGGGTVVLGKCTVDPSISKEGNLYEIYNEPNQENWVYDETYTGKSEEYSPKCSESYEYLGTFTQFGNVNTKDDIPFAPIASSKGGGIYAGMCYYFWGEQYWGTLGVSSQVGLCFRGYSHARVCSPRSVFCYYNSNYTYKYYAGLAQVRLKVGATSAQPK